MPDVRTVPALPWPTGDGGGTIKLSRRISEDEFLAGAVKFTFDNAGRESVGSVVRDQNNQLIIRVDNDIFIVSPFPYGTDTLTLTRSAGEAAQAYSLINVELNKLEPGIYAFEEGSAYVIRVTEDNTALPLYSSAFPEAFQGTWWSCSGGVVSTFTTGYPLMTSDKTTLLSLLSKYGITVVDGNGEKVETLTAEEVTII